MLESNFDHVSSYFWPSFLDDFLEASGSIFGVMLLHFGRSFGVFFPTLRKMAHPTKVLQIAVKSRVGRLEKRPKNLPKMKKKRHEHEGCKNMDFGWIFALFVKAFGSILGAKARSKIE